MNGIPAPSTDLRIVAQPGGPEITISATPTGQHGAGTADEADRIIAALKTIDELTAPPKSFADFMVRALGPQVPV
jgi:hypothetical protein